MSDYPGRPYPPKQTVKDAECCPPGCVTKQAKEQAGTNWDHLVDSSHEVTPKLEIPETDCPA